MSIYKYAFGDLIKISIISVSLFLFLGIPIPPKFQLDFACWFTIFTFSIIFYNTFSFSKWISFLQNRNLLHIYRNSYYINCFGNSIYSYDQYGSVLRHKKLIIASLTIFNFNIVKIKKLILIM